MGDTVELSLTQHAPPTLITMSADPASPAEGDTVTVTLTLNRPAERGGQLVTITPGGTATHSSIHHGGDGDWHISDFSWGTDGLGNFKSFVIPRGETSHEATLTIFEDEVADPGETLTVTATSTGTGHPLQSDPLRLSIRDGGSAGACANCGTEGEVGVAKTYSVSAQARAVEGQAAELTLTLDEAAPAGGVEFTVAANPGTAGTEDVGAITSPVKVPGGDTTLAIAIPTADDAVDEGDESFTVTVAAVEPGWLAEVGNDTATVTITDNDTAGVTVNAASPLSVDEGGTAAYTVVLDSKPTHDVTISADSGDNGAPTVFPAAFTIAPEHWNVPETFLVSGVADDDSQDETVGIGHRITSQDGKYAVPVGSVSVSVTDTTQSQEQNQEQPPAGKYAELITQMKEWRNDPQWVDDKTHTDRWDRALLALGETVADASLTPMTGDEALALADKGWQRWVEVAAAIKDMETPNRAPTVSAALGDVTVVNGDASGARQVSLSGVFSDADDDDLTLTAASSDETVAIVGVSDDQAVLLIIGDYRGTATVTVTASDGNGGTATDTFTVTVKAAPVVASAIGDLTCLEAGATQEVSLSGVFRDADGDSLTIAAASSNTAAATVSVTSDYGKLTVTGVAAGTTAITVTARDSDGNRVSDAFDVSVVKAPEAQEPDPPQQREQTPQEKYAGLIAEIKQWRNDPQWVDNKSHTDRWDRALLAFGVTVANSSLTPMTASEAQALADRGWGRWVEVAAAIKDLEAG